MNFLTPYLPKCSTAEVKELLEHLRLPEPESVTFPTSQGALHQIILLKWPEEVLKDLIAARSLALHPDDSPDTLLLRVAGKEMPTVKLENEAATLIWLSSNTTIPVPQLINHDSTVGNPLGHEYMIMTFRHGSDGAKIYRQLTEKQMDYVLDQLADYLMQLYTKPFKHIGGLKTTPDGHIVPGPVVDETQWFTPEIKKFWPKKITYEDLNPHSSDGYSSLTAFLTAYMSCYVRAISLHPALQSLPYLSHTNIKLLNTFLEFINNPDVASEINDVPYILAHRDLHFGQILLDPETARITAIIDWEFAQVTAVPLWERCFLWNGDNTVPFTDVVRAERASLREQWKTRVGNLEGGQKMLSDTVWKNKPQEAAWDVVNYMRCIVEVVPRSVQMDDAKNWWREIVRALRELGIGHTVGPDARRPSAADFVAKKLQENEDAEDTTPPGARRKYERPDKETMADAKKRISEDFGRDETYSDVMHKMLVDDSARKFTDGTNSDGA